MKKVLYTSLVVGMGVLTLATLSACRGAGSAKALRTIEKAIFENKKSVSNVGKYADDVLRIIDKSSNTSSSTAETYQCHDCAGYGEVAVVDEYGDYLYSAKCPTCYGIGRIRTSD